MAVTAPFAAALMVPRASAKTFSPATPAMPKAADSDSSATSGNAAKLAVLSIRKLNKRTAVFGDWTVVVHQAHIQ